MRHSLIAKDWDIANLHLFSVGSPSTNPN